MLDKMDIVDRFYEKYKGIDGFVGVCPEVDKDGQNELLVIVNDLNSEIVTHLESLSSFEDLPINILDKTDFIFNNGNVS